MNPQPHLRSYRPGGWFGIFGAHAVVLLPPSEKHRVAALWELVDDGEGFDEVLDAILTAGLRDLSGFVLVSEVDTGTKVVIRGAAVAAFVADGEMVELAGASDTTWVERSLSGVSQMFVQVEPTEEEGEDLVIGNGLVRVARVEQPPYRSEEEPEGDRGVGEYLPAADETPTAEPELASEPGRGPDSEGPDEEPETQGPETEGPETEGPDQGPETELLPVAEPEQEPPIWEARAPESDESSPPPLPPEPPPPVASSFVDHTDHDGLTHPGDADPSGFARPSPGIPGQQPAPAVTAYPVARLHFSSGETVDVDRVILVGRAPEARRFSATEDPRLVPVPSPHQEISGTHLELRPGAGADHGAAVVTDLGSTNGTVLVQPGLPPEDLQPGIAVNLVPGAVIDLGDGVTISVTHA